MRRKIGLRGALLHEPPVLMLDEPLAGLDPYSARRIKDLSRNLRLRGNTVFLSTHVLEVAERVCDRVAILSQGRLIAVGTMEVLRTQAKSTTETTLDLIHKTKPYEYADGLRDLQLAVLLAFLSIFAWFSLTLIGMRWYVQLIIILVEMFGRWAPCLRSLPQAVPGTGPTPKEIGCGRSSPAFNNFGTEEDLRGEIPPPIVEDP